MFEEFDQKEAKQAAIVAVTASFNNNKNIEPKVVEDIVDMAIKIDMQYIKQLEQNPEQQYDEEKIYKQIILEVKKKYPKTKINVPEVVDCYMEAMEIYLENIGAIDWE